MWKRFYVVTRDLHLYVGLFLAPFVLVFAVSVFSIVHAPSGQVREATSERVATELDVSPDLERLSGREQLVALRPVLTGLGVTGEVNFIRKIAKEHRLVVPVVIPGRETTVDLNLENRTAAISVRNTGLSDALVHLHKMPGPHNVNLRGNSGYIRAWRWIADVSSYGLLFLTVSGLYLWIALRAERQIGLVLLFLGALSFLGIVYAITF